MFLSRRSANELLQKEKNLVRSLEVEVFFPLHFYCTPLRRIDVNISFLQCVYGSQQPSSSPTDCSKLYNLSKPRRTSSHNLSHHSSLMNLLRILEKMNSKLGGQLSQWTTKLKKRGKGGKVTKKKRYRLQKHNHVLHLEHLCVFNRSWDILLKDVIKAKWGQSQSDSMSGEHEYVYEIRL